MAVKSEKGKNHPRPLDVWIQDLYIPLSKSVDQSKLQSQPKLKDGETPSLNGSNCKELWSFLQSTTDTVGSLTVNL